MRASTCAVGSVVYVLWGRGGAEGSPSRAASFALSVTGDEQTPEAFIKRAERLAEAHGRTNELYSYVLSFHPDEFDVTRQEDLDRVRDIAVEMTGRMHTADYLIVVHSDAAGGHAHAHILVINHDNITGRSLQRYTSWRHGLHQLNDRVMAEHGLAVLPDPTEPRPDWEQRRESFSPGGFEQVLGDRVYAALLDPRSTDREAFAEVLEEQGVTLAITARDGWSYKMRREDTGRIGRRKASRLTPEFTAEGAQVVLDYHYHQRQRELGGEQERERVRQAAPAGAGAGAEGGQRAAVDLDVEGRRRQAAARRAEDERREAERVPDHDGRGPRLEARPSIDLAGARARLDAAGQRRAERAAERDRADAEQRRRAAERERARAATRRVSRDATRPRGACDDAASQQADDDYGLSL